MSSFDMFGFFAPKENILPKEKKKFVCEPLVFADSVIIKEDLEKLSGYNSKCKVEKQTERLAQWFKILRNIFLMPFLLIFNMIRNMVTKKYRKPPYNMRQSGWPLPKAKLCGGRNGGDTPHDESHDYDDPSQELSNDESNELDDQVPNHLVPPSEYENYKIEIIQGDKKNSEWQTN